MPHIQKMNSGIFNLKDGLGLLFNLESIKSLVLSTKYVE
jgi:hypothetical protein